MRATRAQGKRRPGASVPPATRRTAGAPPGRVVEVRDAGGPGDAGRALGLLSRAVALAWLATLTACAARLEPPSAASAGTVPPNRPNPPNTVPPNTPNTVPPNTVPPNTVPPNTVPPNTVPPNPQNTVPQNTAPQNTAPSNTLPPTASPPGEGSLPWIEDDLGVAQQRAAARGVPLIIDLWAPWCHTCLSMQRFVLRDARILARADEFVWLALDTDRANNVAALTSLPLHVWPTFYALSPAGDVRARHSGAASVEEFLAFLARARTADVSADEAQRALREGDRAWTEGRFADAARAFTRALERGGPTFAQRHQARVAALGAWLEAGEPAACAEVPDAVLQDAATARSASTTDFLSLVLACSERAAHPARAGLLARIAAPTGPLRTLLADPQAALSIDDRSDALRVLRDVEVALGHAEEARRLAEEQSALLEGYVATLEDARAHMTFHWPRSEVAHFLGRGESLLAALRESVAALPDEYEPPYRLAWLLHKLKRDEEALPHAARAAGLAYGPRRCRALLLLAELHEARGDIAAARAAYADTLAWIEQLPPFRGRADALGQARARMDALGRAPLPAPARGR